VKAMKYSIIIPCRNCAHYLGDQLEALAAQRIESPWEVIVVDNASTDRPDRVVAWFQRIMPQLKLVRACGGTGVSYARNQGVAAANGEIILFCDADDVVAPGWLEAIDRAMDRHDFVTGPAEYDKLNVNSGTRAALRTSARTWDFLPFLPHAIGCNMGIRRTVHDAVGGFDEALFSADDIDYSWRVQLAGTELHFVSDAIVHYRLRDSAWHAFRQFMRHGEYSVQLYKKFLDRGVGRKSWKDGARTWANLLRQLPQLARSKNRARWVRHFGMALGRIKGSIKHRVMAV